MQVGRTTTAAAVAVAAAWMLAACQPLPDEYTFRNESTRIVTVGDTEVRPGGTETVTFNRTPCMEGVRLPTDDPRAMVVIEQRVCDGDTVTIRPRDVITDEATLTVINGTNLEVRVRDWSHDFFERVGPGATFRLPLVRRAGGCIDTYITAEAIADTTALATQAPERHVAGAPLSTQAPERVCDGDTWLIEMEDF